MTAVGLLPMAVAGIDIEKLVLGASDMQKYLTSGEIVRNPAYQYACLRNLYYKKGYKIEMLVLNLNSVGFINGGYSSLEKAKERIIKDFFHHQETSVKNCMLWDSIFRMERP